MVIERTLSCCNCECCLGSVELSANTATAGEYLSAVFGAHPSPEAHFPTTLNL